MSDHRSPRISVLMPAHNAASYVEAAVNSILSQTFSDFEFLIVDDASTDDTWEILCALAGTDPRIKLFRNDTSLHVPENMNRLVQKAVGEYIARMDADDIALPRRFELQVAALDTGKIDVCGTGFIEFPISQPVVMNGPADCDEVRICLLFECTIRQPTVMMKRDLLLRTQYRPDAVPTADYDLWVRLSGHARITNLPEALLFWRRHPGQITLQNESRNLLAARKVRKMALESFGISPTSRELDLHCDIWTADSPKTWTDVLDTESWLIKLFSSLGDRPAVRKQLSYRWYKFCLKCAPFGFQTYRRFKQSPLCDAVPYRRGEAAMIFIMCLLKARYKSRTYWALFSILPKAFRERSRVHRAAHILKDLTRD